MKHFLVVVDLQKDFIDGALGTQQALSILPAAAEKISAFEGEIFVTLDTHPQDYLHTAEGRHLPIAHCIRGSEGWHLHEAIAHALAEKAYTTVEKPTFGSVVLPELIANAAGASDFDITLIGVCTDICVVSNALLLKAHFPEKEIRVDASCCAGVTPESHTAALATMRMCQIQIDP